MELVKIFVISYSLTILTALGMDQSQSKLVQTILKQERTKKCTLLLYKLSSEDVLENFEASTMPVLTMDNMETDTPNTLYSLLSLSTNCFIVFADSRTLTSNDDLALLLSKTFYKTIYIFGSVNNEIGANLMQSRVKENVVFVNSASSNTGFINRKFKYLK
jgi:hypothetical protein